MGEYKRMYINHLMKKGWYTAPKPDAIQLKKLEDSLRLLNEKKAAQNPKKLKDTTKNNKT